MLKENIKLENKCTIKLMNQPTTITEKTKLASFDLKTCIPNTIQTKLTDNQENKQLIMCIRTILNQNFIQINNKIKKNCWEAQCLEYYRKYSCKKQKKSIFKT